MGGRLRLLMIVGCLAMLQGCYLLKQGSYLLRYTGKATDNRKILEASGTPASTRRFLERVEDISAYAVNELGLEKNKNYSRYVEIDRDFLAYVVSAAGEHCLEPYLWNFPLVGKVPYKGFYEKEDALKEASRIKDKGYDVWIRKVDAFSTLGYLTDPLYSYMEEYPIYNLANLIIHEQAHATLFLKGQGDFNENFATFVGDTGAKLYVADRFGENSEEYRMIFLREEDRNTFKEELHILRRNLSELYEESPEDMDDKKAALFYEFKEHIKNDYSGLFKTDIYKHVPELPMNNAFISLYSLYNAHTGIFEEIYEKCDRDLRKTIHTVREAVEGAKDGYVAMRQRG